MLKTFLDAKPLYYDEIDYTRMPRVYEKIKHHLKIPKVIHLIGTNGKGTTGRFLASALYSLGFTTGHYTSPHILDFNERIWLNGENSTNENLEKAHQTLLTFLTKEDAENLSYFEYTTLLAMVVFKDLEYLVLEAGLGGEHDATAIFPKLLTLITTIDMDHQAFLGDTLQEITITKLNAIDKVAIIGTQVHTQVYELAQSLAQSKSLEIIQHNTLLQKEDLQKIQKISKTLSLVPYLIENLKLSVAALKFLGIEYDIENFKDAKLFGRLTPYTEKILIDVGHNPLAARSIVDALKGEKFTLIYNSYKDKDYEEILRILKPILDNVEILEIDDTRIERKEVLQNVLKKLDIVFSDYIKIDRCKRYLVFGSFSVVEKFLRVYHD
jgi:dihydrofolate synthase / folylpolyglutamate synthase